MNFLLADVAPILPDPPSEPVALSLWPVMIAACFIALAWAGVAVLVSKRLPIVARVAIALVAVLTVMGPAGILWAKWNGAQQEQYAAELAAHEAECARLKAANRSRRRNREHDRYETEMRREMELQLQYGDKLLAELQTANDEELLAAYVKLRSHYIEVMMSSRHFDVVVADFKKTDTWLSALRSISSSDRLATAKKTAATLQETRSLLNSWEEGEANLSTYFQDAEASE